MTLVRPELEKNASCSLGAPPLKVSKLWELRDHSSLTGTMEISKLKMESPSELYGPKGLH